MGLYSNRKHKSIILFFCCFFYKQIPNTNLISYAKNTIEFLVYLEIFNIYITNISAILFSVRLRTRN